ncbi:hypothetical protein EMPS_10471 [Entomortierella parvispora]|uniref:ABC transporter domain-containing protein n=1 Tax=Entomortierella parvispora TaxID=205924 RepID=A0A9P3M1D2_9FUNG|nr:hypothetical protein EMPS_10471 [Entomortierella parvispora]
MDSGNDSAAHLPSSSRLTAQAAFDVVSEPSASKQLVALGIKNVKVRTRDLPQTMYGPTDTRSLSLTHAPVWMMLVLVFLHLSAKSAPDHMAVKALPFLSDDTCKSTTDCTYFGYTGIPATDPIIAELTSFFAASEPQSVVPKLYASEADMNSAYEASPVNFVVGVVFLGPSTNLSLPSTAAGSPSDLYQYTILANHTAAVYDDYLDTRFATAQAYIERAAINLRRKANNKPPLSSPLPLKISPEVTNSGAGRTFISYANFVGLGSSINSSLNPYYIIFCFQAVWLGVLSILVVEKKKKIRMAMTMMGMTQNPYLVSVWLMQNIQNLVTCALMVFILFVGKIFSYTNAFIVYLLLILFSFNATAFGSIAAVAVPDPKKTNQASFLILILTVGSYGICAALVFGSGKVLNPTTETLLFLIPSVALGRAISYITGIEAALGGVTFENISTGPCGKALWMMALDCIIFYFLAWYLDAVFPGEFGNPLPFDFLLRPSYWGLGQYQGGESAMNPAPLSSPTTHNLDPSDDSDHVDMFEETDISRIAPADRSIIQVRNLRKSFDTAIGLGYSIPLFGLLFRVLIPPKASRTRGLFKGSQKQEVVEGLNLEVHRNEILGFLGHNGAGKTTALSIIMGMLKPSSGSITVNGHVLPGSDGIAQRDMDLRTLGEVQKLMGVCPQHDVLFDTLTAWETVQLYATIKGVRVLGHKGRDTQDIQADEKALLEEYLDHLLDDVYLKEKKHERVQTYSGGMKRKLSVALAFLGDPKVVLLDEPTTGMDVFTRKQVWQLMQDSKAGRAILLTTHSMEEADALGDRIAILSHGKLQTLGSSLFLKNRFGLGYRLSLEKRRVMLADHKSQQQQQQCHYHEQHLEIQSTSLLGNHDGESDQVVLFDEEKATAIVQEHFSDATIDVNTATDITYVLPTTGTVEQRGGRTAQEYIRDKKAALPALFAQLDAEIAANRLGVKSVGLSLTTLEEVFVSLQEQEEAENLAKEEAEAAKNQK